MNNPLENVPLNTKVCYVMAKTPKGCEVYMPVDSFIDSYISQQKVDLQNWLNVTYPLPDDNEPMLA